MFDLEEANKSLQSIIDASWVEIVKHRRAGVDDEQFVLKLFREFVSLDGVAPPNAGFMHMALSCYRLAIQNNYIKELEDKIEFYKDSIDMLLDINTV